MVTVSETYHDRGMLKWLPFEALEAQAEYHADLHTRMAEEDRPRLSEDQCAAMQYAVEEAWMKKRPLRVLHFENGRRRKIAGHLSGIDREQRLLFIDDAPLAFCDLVDIRVL